MPRLPSGLEVEAEAEREKVCIRGLLRLAMDGCGVGRWVVVIPREDWLRRSVSIATSYKASGFMRAALVRCSSHCVVLNGFGVTRGTRLGGREEGKQVTYVALLILAQELGVLWHQHSAGILVTRCSGGGCD